MTSMKNLWCIVVAILIVEQILTVSSEEFNIESLGCDSCGRDCSAVCGSRQFRSCCFNYIKKRSQSPPAAPVPNFGAGGGGGSSANTYESFGMASDSGRGLNPESLESSRNVLVLAEVPSPLRSRQQQPPSLSPPRKFSLSTLI